MIRLISERLTWLFGQALWRLRHGFEKPIPLHERWIVVRDQGGATDTEWNFCQLMFASPRAAERWVVNHINRHPDADPNELFIMPGEYRQETP